MRVAWIVLLVTALASSTLFGKCMSGRIEIWPSAGEIPRNTQFVIDAYGKYVEPLGSLERCDLSLVASDHSICLEPVSFAIGGVHVGQLVLVPGSDLQPGITYELRSSAEGLPDVEKWAGGSKSATWIVRSIWDSSTPKWSSKPVVDSVFNEPLGCGTALGARLDAQFEVQEQIRLRATVFGSDGDLLGEYLLDPPYEGLHSIGRGMCSGEFQFVPGSSYRVKLQPVDVSGNAGEIREVTFGVPLEPDG